MDCSGQKYDRIIRSERKSLSLIESMLQEMRIIFSLSDEQYYNLLITLTEAVNNAIVHGNKLDNNKSVIIKAECEKSVLMVSVQDQGKGFDYENLEDPLLPENLTKESGRGIFIMKKIADKVEFDCSTQGTLLKIYFRFDE